MIVEIAEKITIANPAREVIEWCNKELFIKNPVYEQLIKAKKEDLIRFKHVPEFMSFARRNGNEIIIPFGCLYSIWPLIRNSKIITRFAESHPISIKNIPINDSKYQLRDYQKSAIEALYKAKGGILQAGCGSGKTLVGIELIHKIGEKFLWICYTKDLLRQAKNRFLELYPNMDIGTITDGKIEIGKDGAISTIQTLCNIDPAEYEGVFNIVVADECHRFASDISKYRMCDKVFSHINARYRYGLSATPFRFDTLTKTLYFNFGAHPSGEFRPTFMVDRKDCEVLTAEFQRFDVHTKMTYDFLDSDGKIDTSKIISCLCENKERNEEITNKIKSLCDEGRKIVVLTKRVNHCHVLEQMISEKGINVKAVTGETPKKQRIEAIDNPSTWQVLVATMELLKEGLDIKELDTVMMTLPVKDKSGIIQSCGRCERVLEGKKKPIYIAVCDVNIGYCLGSVRKQKEYLKNRE